MGNFLNT